MKPPRSNSQRRRTAHVLLATLLAMGSATATRAQSFGVWRNPKDTVRVEIRACGQGGACGYVVQATAKAQADALKGSGRPLIGMQLFRDFVPQDARTWRGRVYVPDLNRTFSGTAELVDQRTFRASGCLIARLGCRSQIWRRVDG